MSGEIIPSAASLAEDLRKAEQLLSKLGSGGQADQCIPSLLAALWISVERLRAALQTSAADKDWTDSEAATIAKGRAIGVEARPGERMSDYRARLTEAIAQRGRQ